MVFVTIIMEMVRFASLYLTVCTSAVPASPGGDHVREILQSH